MTKTTINNCNHSLQKKASRIAWNDLRLILITARTGTVKAAAQHLRTTESTVSRHLSAVENSVGIALFERTASGLRPTAACTELIGYIARAERELDAGLVAAVDADTALVGRVRLTAVPILMNHLIIPAAQDFLSHHPFIELELIASPADLSIIRRETDLAIRLSRPSNDFSALTRRIGALKYGVYASARRGMGPPSDLPWITYEDEMAELPQAKWIAKRVTTQHEAQSNMLCNDADGLLAALHTGIGKTVLPKLIAASRSELVEMPGFGDVPTREVWLLCHPNLAVTARILAVTEWLEQLFATA